MKEGTYVRSAGQPEITAAAVYGYLPTTIDPTLPPGVLLVRGAGSVITTTDGRMLSVPAEPGREVQWAVLRRLVDGRWEAVGSDFDTLDDCRGTMDDWRRDAPDGTYAYGWRPVVPWTPVEAQP